MERDEALYIARELEKNNIGIIFDNKYHQILIDNFERIIDLLLNIFECENLEDILDKFISIPECKNWMTNNYIKLISHTSQDYLPLILKKLDYIPEVSDLIGGKFDKSYLSGIVLSKFVDIHYEVLKDEKALEFFRELFNEVMKVEKCNIKDIRFVKIGTTSTVWQIGKMVIKVGDSRRTPKIPFNKRVLLPYLRTSIPRLKNEQNISDVFEDKNPLCFVEVMPFIKKIKNMKTEEKEEIFSEFKKAHIVYKDWIDENFGKLPQNGNKFDWNDITFVDLRSLGFILNDDDDAKKILEECNALKEDAIVILDSDSINIVHEGEVIEKVYINYDERTNVTPSILRLNNRSDDSISDDVLGTIS